MIMTSAAVRNTAGSARRAGGHKSRSSMVLTIDSLSSFKIDNSMFVRMILLLILFAALVSGCGQRASQTERGPAPHEQAPFSEGEHIDLVLINQSAEPIFAVILQTADGGQSTENLLQEGPLPIGQSITLHDVPAGIWHIIVQDVDGKSRIYPSQTLHSEQAYSLIIDAYHWD